MSEPARPDFEILDSQGKEYHRWVSNVEQTFIGKDLTHTLKPESSLEAASAKEKSQALMFLRRHIDHSLKMQYIKKTDPKELWDALYQRFNDVHTTLLPELLAKWDETRLLDYPTIEEF